MTNLEYSKTKPFLQTCVIVGIKPTARQASKYRRKKGAAYRISVLGDKAVHIPEEAIVK